jgi:hypothetical protein
MKYELELSVCNNPKISNNLFRISLFFFYKNFGRISPNLVYLKLSTISTLVTNKPFSTIQSFYFIPTFHNQQYFTSSNISIQGIIMLTN